MNKRIFVSIDLPPKIREELKSRQRPDIRWIKWMKLGNLHITLNFLGELTEAKIEMAKDVIRETTPFYKPFPIRIAKTRAERDMLWLVPDESDQLWQLQKELKEKFKKAHLLKRERRPYSPHILYAKSKTGRPMLWQPEVFEPLEFVDDKINLYESELTPEAATHTLIDSFSLG